MQHIIFHLVTRSRSLPLLKPSDNGRKSRNDSGVVLNDEISNFQPISIIHNRRRIKTNTANEFVMHTSSHVCIQKKTNNSTSSNSKYLTHSSCRFHWFFHIFSLFIISLLFSFLKYFPLDN